MAYHIQLASKDDAYDVMVGMQKIIKRFGSVTVHDVNDLLGLPSTYSDHRKGWMSDLLDLDIFEDRDGWCIRLPDPVDITINV